MATLTEEEIGQKIDEFDATYQDFDKDAFSDWLETIDSIEIVVSDERRKISIRVSLDDFAKLSENKAFSQYLNLALMNKYKYSHINYLISFGESS